MTPEEFLKLTPQEARIEIAREARIKREAARSPTVEGLRTTATKTKKQAVAEMWKRAVTRDNE